MDRVVVAERSYEPLEGFELPNVREIEDLDQFDVSTVGPVVSVDSHYTVPRDIWYEGFPERLRDKAPRVWFDDGYYKVGFNGVSLIPDYAAINFQGYDSLPGTTQIEARLKDLDAEGVDKELIYGNAALVLLKYPDLEVREWMYRIFNEHLLEVGAQSNGRFLGVALPNYWDPKKWATEFKDIARDFKTLMLPLKPGPGLDGKELRYADDSMDDMWSAIEESGLPVSLHIGENLFEGRGACGTSTLANFAPFREMMGNLVFGGILDRHPKLKVAWIEAGLNWVPGCIQDMETICRSHGKVADWQLQHSPQYYWDTHMYASFMTDPIGLEMIDRIGVDHALWASDYPHLESTYGYGKSAIKEILDKTGLENTRKIVGGNAIELFKL